MKSNLWLHREKCEEKYEKQSAFFRFSHDHEFRAGIHRNRIAIDFCSKSVIFCLSSQWMKSNLDLVIRTNSKIE